jgi:hypothetical protein
LHRNIKEGDWTYSLPQYGVKYGESLLNCYKVGRRTLNSVDP